MKHPLLDLIAADEPALDRMSAAYQAEFDRWSAQRSTSRVGVYELIVAATEGDFGDTISLTKRECKDKHDAVMWLNTYRGRASMRAALEVALEAI